MRRRVRIRLTARPDVNAHNGWAHRRRQLFL